MSAMYQWCLYSWDCVLSPIVLLIPCLSLLSVSSSLLGNIYLGFIPHGLCLSFWELWETWMVLLANCYRNPKSVTHSLPRALCKYQCRWGRINLDLHAGARWERQKVVLHEKKKAPYTSVAWWSDKELLVYRKGRGDFEVCKLFCCLVVILWLTELNISFRHRNLKISHVIS